MAMQVLQAQNQPTDQYIRPIVSIPETRTTEYLGYRRWLLIFPETLLKQPVGTLPAQDF